MKVELLNQSLYSMYTGFLANSSEAMFYHSLKYKQFLENLLSCSCEYYLAISSEGIEAALPLMRSKGPLGDVINSLPYYGSNGGLLGHNGNAKRLLIEKYNELITSDSVASSTVVCNPLSNDDPVEINYNVEDLRIGQWTNICSQSISNELMDSFDSSTRRNIRKAIKSSIEVRVDNSCMDFLRSTHHKNMCEIGGLAKGDDFFEAIPRYFDAGTDYNIYVACLDGEIIGALLLFYFSDTVEYFTPAMLTKYRNLQALPLTIYKAMQDASAKGYRNWNWGGTWLTQEGVYKFKKKWAAEDREYKYLCFINKMEILKETKERLLDGYPSFFVCPFQQLES